jgi:hypothetical protein
MIKTIMLKLINESFEGQWCRTSLENFQAIISALMKT